MSKELEEFYAFVEEKFRGDPNDVKNKLKVYIPIFKELKSKKGNLKILDLGCGKGEFIELLKEDLNLDAEGVEKNLKVYEECKNKGLKVCYGDALDFLKKAKDSYYDIITMFHVIEHLNPEYVLKLFKEVYRTLKDDGLFIIETPYFFNPYVGLNNFWWDITHIKPYPPEVLKYIGEWSGFKEIKVYFLNPLPVENIFKGLARDVCVMFFKEGSNGGVSLRSYVNMEDLLSSTYLNLKEIKSIQDMCLSMYNSRPWRIYRKLANYKKNIRAYFSIHSLLRSIYNFIKNKEHIYNFIYRIINKFPHLRNWLKTLLIAENVKRHKNIQEKIILKRLKIARGESLSEE